MVETTESIINRGIDKEQSSKLSIKSIDNRVDYLHNKLCQVLGDKSYGIGHTYKIAKKLGDKDILDLADYCKRKAYKPAAAFITLCERKMAKL